MRKVKYSLASSLDNFIARVDGGVDWILMDGDVMKDMAGFFKSINTILIGRKTYDFALSQGPEARHEETFMGMKTYVFSRTMKGEIVAGPEIVSENAGEFVRNLKEESGKDIWLMGGGNLAASLFREKLVDEISLAIHPVLLGSGVPLFPEIESQVDLQLLDCKTYKSGLLSVTYRVKNDV